MGITETRTAIASGELLFTELGSSLRGDASLLGDVVNLAARLLSISESSRTPVCDKSTYDVKGKAEMVPVYGPKKQAGTNLDAKNVVSVGYGPERASLMEKYQDWSSGRSSCVCVIEGKSGSGKSTLLQNFVQTITEVGISFCISSSSEIEQYTAFIALQNPLEMLIDTFKALPLLSDNIIPKTDSNRLGLNKQSTGSVSAMSTSDTVSSRYTRRRSIGSSRDLLDERRLFQNMMRAVEEDPMSYTALSSILPNRIKEAKDHSSPQDALARRNIAKNVIVKLFKLLTSQRKMVFIFDDCQWTDAVSLEVLQNAAVECPQVCIIFFTRPIEREHETMQKIVSAPGVLHMKLGGLRIEETEQLIVRKLEQVKTIKVVEPNLLKAIYQHCQGHPLYIDMLIGALNVEDLDSAVEITTSGMLRAKEWDLFEETVKKIQNAGAALTQFDRLDDEFKNLLRKASIFGQYFSLTDIAESLGLGDMTVETCIENIQRMDKYSFLAYHNVSDIADGEMYFRHISVMTAIYESLPYEQRLEMHLSVGDHFKERMIEHKAETLLMPIVAYHYSRTLDVENQIKYLETLAYDNIRQSFYQEAANSLEKLMELVKRKEFIETHAPPETRAALLDPCRWADWIAHLSWAYIGEKKHLEVIPELCVKAMTLLGIPFPTTIKEFKSGLLQKAFQLFFVLWPKTKGGMKVYEHRGVKCRYLPVGTIGHNVGDGCRNGNCIACPKRHRVALLCYKSFLIRGLNMPDVVPEGLAYALLGICSESIKTGGTDAGVSEWVESCHWGLISLYWKLPFIGRKFLQQAELLEKTRVSAKAEATISLVGLVNFNIGKPEASYLYMERSVAHFKRQLDNSGVMSTMGMLYQFGFWLGKIHELEDVMAPYTTFELDACAEILRYQVFLQRALIAGMEIYHD
ncbi:hypothetical protein HDV05_002487 [Chytridiales sp. JEL 0842]|nr:hypothetical protein HDV05_002487 [Chytridiales sp. JEL 0842]